MRDELKTLMAAWHAAWFAKDAAAIAQMMSEDYVYVAPNGAILDRAAILQVVGDPTYGLTGGTHAETTVVMLGDGGALVRHRWQGTGTFRRPGIRESLPSLRHGLRPFERPVVHSVQSSAGLSVLSYREPSSKSASSAGRSQPPRSAAAS